MEDFFLGGEDESEDASTFGVVVVMSARGSFLTFLPADIKKKSFRAFWTVDPVPRYSMSENLLAHFYPRDSIFFLFKLFLFFSIWHGERALYFRIFL